MNNNKTTKQEKKKRIVLLDAHAIIHRAYHALPNFTSSKGEPTGALYGISAMLIKIISELKPDYLFACYDLPQKTFRHEAYEAYKDGRKKADEDLITQIKKSRSIFEAFDIPVYDQPGFEADDLLGTIVKKLEPEIKKEEVEIIIASGDMDTMQLVDGDRVRVYTLKKGINDTILYDEEEVKKRFGFLPKFLPDYKGLRGDPSDNIIGIKGIGEKTATTLIIKFGTIEEIYKQLKKDKTKFKEIGLTPRIISLLEENEEEALFSKTLAQIRLDAPIDFTLPANEWQINLKLEKVEALFNEFEFKSLLARLVSVFNKSSEEEGLFAEKREYDQKQMEELFLALPLLSDKYINPTIADVFDFGGQNNNFAEAKTKIEDQIKKNNLDYVYREIEMPIREEVRKMEERGILIDQEYLKKLKRDFDKDLGQREQKIYQLAGKEFNINSPKQMGEILFVELKIPTKGEGWRIKVNKKSGAYSTNIAQLEKLKEVHPIIGEIVFYRELQKLLSTYVNVILKRVASDGRLHTKFLQLGTTTGRFSSAEPNLQNIPTRTELGKKIRRVFITSPGSKLISFDYSQIELRIAAFLAQDKNLLAIFQMGSDVHGAVAARVFNVPEEEVTKEMRRQAKIINFGIIYGMGINALKDNLKTSKEEAEKFYQNYFIKFPQMMNLLEETKKFAYQNGYTITLFGRRRYFPEINSSLPYLRSATERMAINAPFQGTAADFIKLAIKNVSQRLINEKLNNQVKLLLQIHDELIFEIEEDKLTEAVKLIKEEMENILPAEFIGKKEVIPFLVNYSIGDNWAELKE